MQCGVCSCHKMLAVVCDKCIVKNYNVYVHAVLTSKKSCLTYRSAKRHAGIPNGSNPAKDGHHLCKTWFLPLVPNNSETVTITTNLTENCGPAMRRWRMCDIDCHRMNWQRHASVEEPIKIHIRSHTTWASAQVLFLNSQLHTGFQYMYVK